MVPKLRRTGLIDTTRPFGLGGITSTGVGSGIKDYFLLLIRKMAAPATRINGSAKVPIVDAIDDA